MAKSKTEPIEVLETPAVNEAEARTVVVRLELPRELYDEYADVAAKQDLTVAELMSHRLTRCRTHSSIRSLYFHTSQLMQLETLLQKRPLENPDQVISLIKSAFSFQVGDLPPVPITPTQAKRIHLGATRDQTPYDRLCYIVQGAVAKMTGA